MKRQTGKIGILTFHRSLNNGAVVQCYSLWKRLKNDFPNFDVEVIDYNMPITDKIYPQNLIQYYKYTNSIKVFFAKTIKLIKDPLLLKRFRKKRMVFNSALSEIRLSNKSFFTNNPNSLFEYIQDEYDAIVVGSDAIWNYKLRGFPNPYFLDNSITIPKFSYAASCFGMQYEKIKKDEKERIRTILSDYSFVGVRDSETEKMYLSLQTGNECHHTCDPTLLLDVDDLPVEKSIIVGKMKQKGFDFNKKTIGIMLSPQEAAIVKSIMGSEYQYVSLFNYCSACDVNLFDLNPFEWAYVFRFFVVTFTTYFHGTLLSLKNGVPVISIALRNDFNKTHVSKVEDVLERLKMSDCYFDLEKKNYTAIKAKACQLMNSFDRKKLASDIAKESESYSAFKEAFEKAINNL